ncbi:ABC transporter permease subunit (plasmid) [Haloimpatiens sp. FM7330]|uniref:ABC transporter permease subunit n=1 Tax=Haloimpatiens sp. FM7330 TaxID=3298610 RepID=UPI003640080E
MNKIINKSLFYKEWINVKYITILTTLILLYFKFFGVISELNLNKMNIKENGEIWTNRWFNNGLFVRFSYFYVMVFIIILLAIVLFLGEKNSQTQGFIASMPFTRKEIIINKWIVGTFSIVISFGITYIALSLFYAANLNAIDTTLNPYSDIVKWFFIDVFQYVCIFTFIMFMQTIMGNSIVSSIVGGIILLVPYFIIGILNEIAYKTIEFQENNYICSIFAKLKAWLTIYQYNFPQQEWYDNGKDMFRTFYYTNYELKLVILFILTCLFLYLAYVFYKKRNLEYNLRLLAFKKLEPVFMCGFTVCAGLFIGAILGFGYSSNLNMFWLFTITGCIAGYFISKILVKTLSWGK